MKKPAHTGVLPLIAMLLIPPVYAASVPVVHEDEHVVVRAGIEQAGARALHIGDPLDLLIEVEFDPDSVQVENLDDDFFQRVFAADPAFRLYRPARVTTSEAAGGTLRLAARWQFHVLACPTGMTSCAGEKDYELPVITLDYQLSAGEAGGDSRAARFRPWPGHLALAPAVALADKPDPALADVLPGGAWPEALALSSASTTAAVLAGAGLLLLVASTLEAFRRDHGHLPTVRLHHTATRWEHCLAALDEAGLADDEWSDLLRRGLSWYCLDELGTNPCAWLAAGRPPADPAENAWRAFFIDVLEQDGAPAQKRAEYLRRFRQLAGLDEEDRAA
jgi:hypothetical protein